MNNAFQLFSLLAVNISTKNKVHCSPYRFEVGIYVFPDCNQKIIWPKSVRVSIENFIYFWRILLMITIKNNLKNCCTGYG